MPRTLGVVMANTEPPRHVLNTIAIDSPCSVPWDSMCGDNRVRYCNQCKQQVFDLTEMTTAEATKALDEAANTPCVRFLRGRDGRVMTTDGAAVVRKRIWRRLRRRAAWAASLFSVLFLPACVTQGMPVRYVKSQGAPVRGEAAPALDEPQSSSDNGQESQAEVRNR